MKGPNTSMISGSMTDDWIETMKSFDHRSPNHRFDWYDSLLFNRLPRRAPGEAIGRPLQVDHQRPVLAGTRDGRPMMMTSSPTLSDSRVTP